MKSKHSDEQNYLFITPTEYEEATVKEGVVVVAESGNVGIINIGNLGKKSNQIFCITLIEIFL